MSQNNIMILEVYVGNKKSPAPRTSDWERVCITDATSLHHNHPLIIESVKILLTFWRNSFPKEKHKKVDHDLMTKVMGEDYKCYPELELNDEPYRAPKSLSKSAAKALKNRLARRRI